LGDFRYGGFSEKNFENRQKKMLLREAGVLKIYKTF